MPDYNTKIDRNRIDVRDPEGSYKYLLNEAGVDPEKAYQAYEYLQREYAINKSTFDAEKRLYDNNVDLKDSFKIKSALDKNDIIDSQSLRLDESNKLTSKLMNQYGKIIDDLYYGDNLAFITKKKKDYDSLVSKIGAVNGDLLNAINRGMDSNGNYYLSLSKDNRQYTKSFLDFCDGVNDEFSKYDGRYGHIDNKGVAVKSDGFIGKNLKAFAKAAEPLTSTNIEEPYTKNSNAFRRFYQKLNDKIDKNIKAEDKLIYTETINTGAQNPWQIHLQNLADNASTTNERNFYNGLLDQNRKAYASLMQSVPNFVEEDMKMYNEKTGLFENMTQEDKLNVRNYLQMHINQGKDFSINCLYDPFTGKFSPLISFTFKSGSGSTATETNFKITGDFLHNDIYDEYNNTSKSLPFKSYAEVRRLEDTQGSTNIGFYKDKNDKFSVLDISYEGAFSGDKYYTVRLNDTPITTINKKQADALKLEYNNLLYLSNDPRVSNLSPEDKEANIKEWAKELENTYKSIFKDINVIGTDFENLVRSIIN